MQEFLWHYPILFLESNIDGAFNPFMKALSNSSSHLSTQQVEIFYEKSESYHSWR